jgi:hypothetical protein
MDEIFQQEPINIHHARTEPKATTSVTADDGSRLLEILKLL